MVESRGERGSRGDQGAIRAGAPLRSARVMLSMFANPDQKTSFRSHEE